MFLIYFTVASVLAVAFVNGWTDAPNAITSCVSTGCLKLKHAVLFAAIADFAGAMIVGSLSRRVTDTVMNIADFGADRKTAIIALCAAMCSVVIWAVSAWKFGIPTSESHALIAGLTGAAVAVNGNFSGIDSAEWSKVLKGLVISVFIGFLTGAVILRVVIVVVRNTPKNKTEKLLRYSQIFSGMLMAFMHGAQDSQKFAGILSLVLSFSRRENEINSLLPLVVSSLAIAAGTATGGERIIKTVGTDMVRLRLEQGFSSDLSGALCLFISTLLGYPVSTTHTKTSAVIGVGVADNPESVNRKIVCEMILAWIFTFPGCGLMGWTVTCIFLKIF